MLNVVLDSQPPTVAIWHTLFNYYAILGTAAGVAVISYFVYNMVKYRDKGGGSNNYVDEHEGEHRTNWRRVVLTVALTGSVLAFVQFQTFASIGLLVPPNTGDPIDIKVVGQQFQWTFVYPNGGKVVGTLTVPENETIILHVTSVDVAHSFSIPNLDVAIDAIPGRNNTLWFAAPNSAAVYTIRCKELCGAGHAFMTAKVIVLPPADYARWYAGLGGGK